MRFGEGGGVVGWGCEGCSMCKERAVRRRRTR